MPGYTNNTSLEAIRSMYAQLPFVLVSNNMCWSTVTVPRVVDTFMAS